MKSTIPVLFSAAGLVGLLTAVPPAMGQGRGQLPRPATDEDFQPRNAQKEELGRLLFFDKILSGNENISCATCHHPLTDTGDGLSLPVGEGGHGLGMTRNTGEGLDAVPERVPRNAPHVFNLGALEFTRMFHDGRVEVNPDQPSGFDSPAGILLPQGLDNVLAAQAMFPPTSTTEMAGQEGENAVGTLAAAGDVVGVWEALAERLQMNGQYASMFIAAFDDIDEAEDITFVDAANAIAAWEGAAFRADNSPFDRYLRGERQALSQRQRQGMNLFYGAAGCASCHSGTFQTNQEFAAVSMPQIGPGKDEDHQDFGRELVTQDEQDRCRFRVPSLRNVALTGPWGHAGAYDTLEAVVRHQLDPVAGFYSYDTSQAALPSRPDLDAIDFMVMNDGAMMATIAAACELGPANLNDAQVAALVDFLHALTDPASLDLRSQVPGEVPSGLPVYE